MKQTSVIFQLLSWSESTRGRRVVFEVMDDPDNPCDEHPFKTFTEKNGKVAGQMFAAALVEYDPGTGKPTEPLAPVEELPRREMKPSQLAYLMCRDQEYWDYLNDTVFGSNAKMATEDDCARYLKVTLNITSRSQLDHLDAPAKRFAEMVRGFREWRDIKVRIGGRSIEHGGW